VQYQKCRSLICVDELTSTFRDEMIVKEALKIYPQKIGSRFFLFCHYLFFMFSIPKHHPFLVSIFVKFCQISANFGCVQIGSNFCQFCSIESFFANTV